MKISLIYPGISWSGFNSFGRKNCSECNFINHGIASLASYVKKFGNEVEYIDLRKLKNWKDFRNVLKKSDSRLYGISSTTVDFGYTIKISSIIKNVNKKNIVVVGGVHPTVAPKDALKIKTIDYVVTGEGEIALLKLIKDIEKRRRSIKRLIRGVPCPIEEIPHIDREMFDHRKGEMVNPFVSDLEIPSTTIMSSRGCPFNCTFCQPAERMIFGGKVRIRKIDDVIAELMEIKKKYGLKSFMIHDDLFIISKDRILEFVEKYKKSRIRAKFICQGRVDLIIKFRNEIEKLKGVGLIGIMIGFESGSQRILDFINKRTTVEQNLESAKICHKLGIKIWANYMLGIPTETYWEMIKTLAMIRKIKPEYHSPSLFTPYPQTGLYDYCEKHGLLTFTKYDQYRRGLSGNKIKGFNYSVIRTLIFLFYPWSFKLETMKFIINKFFYKV